MGGGNELKTSQLKEKLAGQQQSFFVKNEGQVTNTENMKVPGVKYSYGNGAVSLYFHKDRVSYVFPKREYVTEKGTPGKDSTLKTKALYRMDMVIKGAGDNVRIKGKEEQSSYSNYFVGKDPIAQVPHYRKLVYKDVYTGIDLVFKLEGNRLKYEYIVRENGDASDIRMQYEGAEALEKQEEGSLSVTNPIGELKEARPVAFVKGNQSEEIPCEFVVGEDKSVRFDVEGDQDKPYVIDPYLSYSTYLGGSNTDVAYDVEVNNEGNGQIYVAGYTSSSSFPNITGVVSYQGNKDGFLAKYSSAGNLQWFTYHGSSVDDRITGVYVDKRSGSSHYPYVVGYSATTNHSSFGTGTHQGTYSNTGVNLASTNIFVQQFNSSGGAQDYVLIGSDKTDLSGGIVVEDNAAYIVGTTFPNSNFKTTTSIQNSCSRGYNRVNPSNADGVIAKFEKDLTGLLYSRYYGGNKDVWLYDIDRIGLFNYVVKGVTAGDDLPKDHNGYQSSYQGGLYDHCLGRMYTGCIKESTYLGGSNQDGSLSQDKVSNSLVVDDNDYIHTTGFTESDQSQGFPITANAYQSTYSSGKDMFYSRFDGNLSTLDYSTYIGSSNDEQGNGIIATSRSDYVIAGKSNGSGLPLQGLAHHPYTTSGNDDGYIIKFKNDAPVWSTYYGGSNNDEMLNLANKPSANEYYTVGFTKSGDYSVTQGANQTTHSGQKDAFITVFDSSRTCISANHTLKTGTWNAPNSISGSYKITGELRIPSNNTVTIDEADLVFGQCAKLVVEQDATLTIQNSNLTHTTCGDETSWKGIKVKSGVDLDIDNTYIRGAFVGVELTDPAEFDITNSTFVYNKHHIIVQGDHLPAPPPVYNSTIKDNTFEEIACYEMEDLPLCNNNREIPTKSWINDCDMIAVGPSSGSTNIRGIKIEGNDLLGPTEDFNLSNGVVVYKGSEVDLFDNWYSNDLSKKSIYYRKSGNIEIANDTIELSGSDHEGIRIMNSSDIDVGHVEITENGTLPDQGIHIEETNLSNTPNADDIHVHDSKIAAVKNGIYVKDLQNSTFKDNYFHELDNNGIEYYASQNFTNGVEISKNKITDLKFGIVVAPDEHPHNAGSGANTSSHTINLTIECNKIWDTDVGIFGCGDMIDQGGPNTAAGNNFDDPNGSSPGVSENTEWDILWQYPVNGGGLSGFTYYHWQNAYTPNSVGVNQSSYNMNGATQSTSDFAINNNPPNQGCYGAWKRSPVASIDNEEESQEIKVFPNPFDETLQIRLQEVEEGQIKVTNLHGREVLNKAYEGKMQILQSSDWTPGTYFIQIIPNSGTIKSRKLLKVQ